MRIILAARIAIRTTIKYRFTASLLAKQVQDTC